MKTKSGIKKIKKGQEKNGQKTLYSSTKHDREDNLNYYSEEIAQLIINKIISLAITEVNKKKAYKKLSYFFQDNYFKYINNYLKLYYLDHEVDNIPSTLKNGDIKTNTNTDSENNINFINNNNNENNTINKKNVDKDNKDNENIKSKKREKMQFSIKIPINTNFWGDIPQPKAVGIDRTFKYENKLKKQVKLKTENNNSIKEEQNDNNIKRNSSSKKKFFTFFNKKFSNNEIVIPKKKRISVLEFCAEDITDDSFQRIKETKEIKELRKIFIEKKNKKQIENTNEIKNKNENEIKTKSNNNETEVKNDNNDDNEEIQIKNNQKSNKVFNPEKLKKEFTSILSNQKEINSGSSLTIIEKEISEMKIEAGKNIQYNRPIIGDNKKKDTFKKLLIKNLLKENNNINEECPIRFKPSGSNFALIHPSVGVTIEEDSCVKSGGTNYYQQYNRFSVQDYNKTLQNEIYNNSVKVNSNYYYNITRGDSDFTLQKEIKGNKILSSINNNSTDNYSSTVGKNVGSFRKSFSNKLFALKNRKKNFLKSKSEISLKNKLK